MAEVKPLKLVDQGGGNGALAEFGVGDKLDTGALQESLKALAGLTGAAGKFPAFTGLSTMRAADILGTVSQLAGLPTGAIIERGSNANGEYIRLADGTQICMRRIAPVDIGAGSFHLHVWTYPAGFSTLPYTLPVPTLNFSSFVNPCSSSIDVGASNTTTATRALIYNLSGSSAPFSITLIAIGRWF
jgi:hypothetical protein